jgi:hypothetical protein
MQITAVNGKQKTSPGLFRRAYEINGYLEAGRCYCWSLEILQSHYVPEPREVPEHLALFMSTSTDLC